MNWFWFALLTMLAWGTADLFYKKGADENDKYSHLKTVIAVGVVMGLHAVFTLIFGDVGYNFVNILVYLPVSLMYILSMAVGYFGLRYLELSISSPIQNSSGAVVCLLCVVFLGQSMDLPIIVAILLICLAVFVLGVLEKRDANLMQSQGEKKYRIGFVAFFIPIIYCVVDALGTFFDAYYLDNVITSPLVDVNVDNIETVANVSYELTFLLSALCCFVYLVIVNKKQQKLKSKQNANAVETESQSQSKSVIITRLSRILAAVFETAGQFAYVYAMSGQAVIAAPMIASYSVVSMILSRIFLKEKLNWKQYLCIAGVMIGVIILGIYDV